MERLRLDIRRLAAVDSDDYVLRLVADKPRHPDGVVEEMRRVEIDAFLERVLLVNADGMDAVKGEDIHLRRDVRGHLADQEPAVAVLLQQKGVGRHRLRLQRLKRLVFNDERLPFADGVVNRADELRPSNSASALVHASIRSVMVHRR